MKILLNNIFIGLMFVIAVKSHALQIGKTFPIAEPDLEELMQSRSSQLNKIKNLDVKKTSALKGIYLPKADKENVRLLTPFYTLDFDLLGKNGEILYPKGYTFNPAAYSKLPFTIWIFDDSQIDFIKSVYKPNDTLILSTGDIIEVNEKLQTRVFLLDTAIQTRLSIRSVPSRVRQIGSQYEVWEGIIHD